MRVIVNQSTALGARTGIGQYTRELLREMRLQAPHDCFDVFPPDWWGKVRRLGSLLRPGRVAAHRQPDGPTPISWTGALSTRLRTWGDDALASYLRLAARW